MTALINNFGFTHSFFVPMPPPVADSFAIESVKEIIANENLLDKFKDRLEDSDNWCQDMAGLLRVSALSLKELTEIIKLLAKVRPHFVTNYVHAYAMIDEPARIEIAKVCAKKTLYGLTGKIKDFKIQSQDGLIDIYNTCIDAFIEKHARLLVERLSLFNITDESSLIKMMARIAAYRPDLVLEYLNKSGIQNENEKHKIILQCTSQVGCKTWELVKIWMVENQQLLLSIPAFSPENMPNRVHVAPHGEMQKVFSLFETFAANPKVELTGRVLWRMKQQGLDYKSQLKNAAFETKLARCHDTTKALFSSMFGPQDILLNQFTFSYYPLDCEFDQLWNMIKQNEAYFNHCNPSHFFAYEFDSAGIGHVFSVIQYKDENNQVKYRILQSWVARHNLNEYMTKRGNDLTSDEFKIFTTGLQSVLQEEFWTLETEIFYKQYFMLSESRLIGAHHLSNDTRLGVSWGISCFAAMESYKVQFDLFKNSCGI